MLLPGFKTWFSALAGFGDYLQSFFASYRGYFDCYAEEHALVYTQLHKEFSSKLEESIDTWLKLNNLGEEEFGEMLRQASLRNDGDGDMIIGTLLGLLDYEPWIGSIFALKQMALVDDGSSANDSAVHCLPQVDEPAAAGVPATPSATMTVVVPNCVAPGQQVQVMSPDGQFFLVEVPGGCAPGSTFDVAYNSSGVGLAVEDN
eukprot:CAMPEP_0176075408 /NCGR_PEP_ID=MMETSP0120_2-20121206/37690_1 /TAXON_ID=160619 /ORGANISM="Kryptoperidinium foliaceum, Strain CCMP 1326" /LENGTH=202 /DNA_ID=CAMNT_0017409113 /DNA_START=166 /DNA_END=774 /DNA_ORIENTATION=+